MYNWYIYSRIWFNIENKIVKLALLSVLLFFMFVQYILR